MIKTSTNFNTDYIISMMMMMSSAKIEEKEKKNFITTPFPLLRLIFMETYKTSHRKILRTCRDNISAMSR
jgi:hypothetical protein